MLFDGGNRLSSDSNFYYLKQISFQPGWLFFLQVWLPSFFRSNFTIPAKFLLPV